jgi:adenylate kinase family enzyme
MLQIQVIGSINSGKSTLAKIISKSLNTLNINTEIIDEENNQKYDKTDLLKLIKIIEKLDGQPIVIETIQSQRGSYANKRLSNNQ